MFPRPGPTRAPGQWNKSVTIRLGTYVIGYCKAMADETGIPCRTPINLYLRDCAQTRRKLRPQRRPDALPCVRYGCGDSAKALRGPKLERLVGFSRASTSQY